MGRRRPPRTVPINVVEYDPAWPTVFEAQAGRIRDALGDRVLGLEHVGSTSVPGLAAKPVIDIDLTVVDSSDEAAYMPALEAVGFVLRIREAKWHEHRCLEMDDPRTNLHVWCPDSPEAIRHRMFRDWLRTHPDDLDLWRCDATRPSGRVSGSAIGADSHAEEERAEAQAVVRRKPADSEGRRRRAGTGLHRRDAGVEERRRAPDRRGHHAHAAGRPQGGQVELAVLRCRGEAGWFLNFSCLTKYIKVAFFQGTLLDRCRPSSRRSTKSGTSTSSKTTTSMSSCSPPG